MGVALLVLECCIAAAEEQMNTRAKAALEQCAGNSWAQLGIPRDCGAASPGILGLNSQGIWG